MLEKAISRVDPTDTALAVLMVGGFVAMLLGRAMGLVWAFAGAVGLLALLMMGTGAAMVRRGYELRRVTPGGLAVAGDGDRVRVEGTARALDDRVTAPVSGEPCLAYRLVADSYGRSAPRRPRLGLLDETTRGGAAFLLDTGEGEVVVAGGGFDVAFRDDTAVELYTESNLPTPLERVVEERSGFDPEFHDMDAYFVEDRLHDGETAFVSGVLDRSPTDASVPRTAEGVVTGSSESWVQRLIPAGPSLIADSSLSDLRRYLLVRGGTLLAAPPLAGGSLAFHLDAVTGPAFLAVAGVAGLPVVVGGAALLAGL